MHFNIALPGPVQYKASLTYYPRGTQHSRGCHILTMRARPSYCLKARLLLARQQNRMSLRKLHCGKHAYYNQPFVLCHGSCNEGMCPNLRVDSRLTKTLCLSLSISTHTMHTSWFEVEQVHYLHSSMLAIFAVDPKSGGGGVQHD